MKAAVVEEFGKAPVYGEFREPVAANGEQVVKVLAAGLHQIVRARAKGTHYTAKGEVPFVPGVDGVGILPDGKRVYFGNLTPPFGTMAELSLASPAFTVPLPNGIDDVTAAGIANPGMSSWAALQYRAKLQPGESVMVLGATGSSGLLSVQNARRLGAKRVVAVGRSADGLRAAQECGADAVVSLAGDEKDVVAALSEQIAAGVNVVLDYIYGRPAELFFEALGKSGAKLTGQLRYVQIGNMAGPTATLPAALLRSVDVALLGSGFGSASLAEIMASLGDFFVEAAREPFRFDVKAMPLAGVEKTWDAPEGRERVVFQP